MGMHNFQKTCVVYEVKSGKILHVHTIMSVFETKPPTQRELEQETLNHFRKNHPRKRDVKILNIKESETSKLPFGVKVDHAARRLVFSKKRDALFTRERPDMLGSHEERKARKKTGTKMKKAPTPSMIVK